LNLAAPPDDLSEREAVDENTDIVGYAMARGAQAVGDNPFALPEGVAVPTVVRMRQVHGAAVHTVDREWLADRPAQPVADALVTAVPGVILLVRVADCVPLLLADVDRSVVGAAHAGRPGLVAGIVPATVARMRELGAGRIVAWLGPHVCGRCYEVPAQMRAEVAAAVPASFSETSWGTPAVDVGAGVVSQLEAEGVEVVDASRCTLEDDDLFSYRRQGVASGRLGGLVWVRPGPGR
jgi:YfiH family protein